MANDYFYGLGRRKSATARARLKNGKGVITINNKPLKEFVANSQNLEWELTRPLTAIDRSGAYDITLVVSGGGPAGQIDACKLAISNALAAMNDDLRSTLKKHGFLKRDPREKERKKYGLKRARKQEQYSKR